MLSRRTLTQILKFVRSYYNMEDDKKVEILKEFTKKIIEEQVDVPPEIMEVVDEHFFEML